MPDAKARVPIIAMTASVLDGIIERCREAGMSDYISKPFGVGNLREILSRWSERGASPVSALAAEPDMRAHSGDMPVLDRSHLDEMLDHIGIEGVADMVTDFAAKTPERLSALLSLAAHADMQALSGAAHSFAGAAAAFGLSELVAIARAIEEASFAGDAARIGELVGRLPAAVDRAVTTLAHAARQAA